MKSRGKAGLFGPTSVMVPICQRSIGVQVRLCKCQRNSSPSTKFSFAELRKDFNKRMDSYSGDKDRHQSEQGFIHCQAQSSTWSNTENAKERSKSTTDAEDPCGGDQDRFTASEETRLLSADESRTGSVVFSPVESPSSSSPALISPPLKVCPDEHNPLSHGAGDQLSKQDHSHSYHIKRKLANFRSDSVFSDVTPMAASSHYQDHRTPQDPRTSSGSEAGGKSASLSSLKPRESKWTSLRKKLGKLNSPTTKKTLEQKPSANPSKTIQDRRSLLQRAKTLSILPVRSSKEKEEHHKKVKERKPRAVEEMFNVGGEMNMIPLELLIDVSDLHISK